MKGGRSGIIGELDKDVGSSQRNDIAGCGHPDESNNVDEGANEDIWPAATEGGQSSSRSIAEHTEQWISEERDEGAGDQYECQGLPFIQVSDLKGTRGSLIARRGGRDSPPLSSTIAMDDTSLFFA